MSARQTGQNGANVVGVGPSALGRQKSRQRSTSGIPALSERRWQAQVVTLARLRGWCIYHTYDSRRSQPGFPDLVLAHPERQRLVFAELKTDVGRLTAAQVGWQAVLELCGCEVYIWRPRDLPDVQRILEAA